MELLMQEFPMYLIDIKSIPKLNGQHDNREMSSIRLNLLTKTTWKLKTPGGILLVQVLFAGAVFPLVCDVFFLVVNWHFFFGFLFWTVSLLLCCGCYLPCLIGLFPRLFSWTVLQLFARAAFLPVFCNITLLFSQAFFLAFCWGCFNACLLMPFPRLFVVAISSPVFCCCSLVDC